jgi:hypothetical protein
MIHLICKGADGATELRQVVVEQTYKDEAFIGKIDLVQTRC